MNQKAIRELIDSFGLCGCGTKPSTSWPIIKSLLERAEDHESHGSFYDSMGGTPSDWVELLAHVLSSWRLIEHGTSIGYAWLTENGKLILSFLREFGTDEGEWPEWIYSFSLDEEG